MPVLRMVRRELFAQARSRGLTQVDAYDDAGYEGVDYETKRLGAIRIEGSPGVRERIDELLEATHEVRIEREEKRKDLVAFDDAMGKVEILQGLRTVFELAIQQSVHVTKDGDLVDGDPVNLGAANRALELMGKQEGMFADTKHLHMHDDTSNLGRAALLAAIEKIDAQLAGVALPGDDARPVNVIEHDQPEAIEGG